MDGVGAAAEGCLAGAGAAHEHMPGAKERPRSFSACGLSYSRGHSGSRICKRGERKIRSRICRMREGKDEGRRGVSESGAVLTVSPGAQRGPSRFARQNLKK